MPLPFLKFFVSVDEKNGCRTSNNQIALNSYKPEPGAIIFFDWDGDAAPDHVGIVESCDGSTVHTIEGNTSDSCAKRSYVIGSTLILGYGGSLY